jgi:hypothetical protein
MPQRQRANRFGGLLQMPQLYGRVTRLAIEHKHAAESRREPRRAVHVVKGVDPLAAVGRLALVVQQHEFDTARDHLLPRLVEGRADLVVRAPGAKRSRWAELAPICRVDRL